MGPRISIAPPLRRSSEPLTRLRDTQLCPHLIKSPEFRKPPLFTDFSSLKPHRDPLSVRLHLPSSSTTRCIHTGRNLGPRSDIRRRVSDLPEWLGPAMRTPQPGLSHDQVAQLRQYSACDISDVLLRLQVPGAGFIADLVQYSSSPEDRVDPPTITVAPISTVLFAPQEQVAGAGPRGESLPASNIPKDVHWADLTEPDTFVVLKQPPGQTHAVCGGIMALRMKVRQATGVVVLGRVRDVVELRSTGLPIWGLGTSTVGAGAGSVPWATQVPVQHGGVVLNPGDIAFHDPSNGIVVIPRDKVDGALELLPQMVAADARVKADLLRGMSVHDAFKLHRA